MDDLGLLRGPAMMIYRQWGGNPWAMLVLSSPQVALVVGLAVCAGAGWVAQTIRQRKGLPAGMAWGLLALGTLVPGLLVLAYSRSRGVVYGNPGEMARILILSLNWAIWGWLAGPVITIVAAALAVPPRHDRADQ